jgi:hypothetical protein
MADTLKVLGQVLPSAGVLTTLYTVPAVTSTIPSALSVCNQSTRETTYRISVAVAGAADDPKQYLVFDAPLLPNETRSPPFTLPSLATTDVVRVQSGNGQVSFNLSGLEIT